MIDFDNVYRGLFIPLFLLEACAYEKFLPTHIAKLMSKKYNTGHRLFIAEPTFHFFFKKLVKSRLVIPLDETHKNRTTYTVNREEFNDEIIEATVESAKVLHNILSNIIKDVKSLDIQIEMEI